MTPGNSQSAGNTQFGLFPVDPAYEILPGLFEGLFEVGDDTKYILNSALERITGEDLLERFSRAIIVRPPSDLRVIRSALEIVGVVTKGDFML